MLGYLLRLGLGRGIQGLLLTTNVVIVATRVPRTQLGSRQAAMALLPHTPTTRRGTSAAARKPALLVAAVVTAVAAALVSCALADGGPGTILQLGDYNVTYYVGTMNASKITRCLCELAALVYKHTPVV